MPFLKSAPLLSGKDVGAVKNESPISTTVALTTAKKVLSTAVTVRTAVAEETTPETNPDPNALSALLKEWCGVHKIISERIAAVTRLLLIV